VVYLARGFTVSLAIFVLTYATLRVLIAAGWLVGERWLARGILRLPPNMMYALLVAPFVASILAVTALAVPAFLKFEPRSGTEEFGPPVVVLSGLALVLFAASCWRTAIVYRRTARFVESWEREAHRVKGATLPIFRTAADAPPLVVAGILRPKLLVSASTAHLLTEAEMARALAHETAHIQNHDNLKKLALRLFSYPPLESMERAWLNSLELAADQSAVRSKREALDLASALVKSSRLAIATPELVTNLAIPDGPLLHARVERLLAWQESEQRPMYGAAALMGLTVSAYIVASRYDLLLWLMHELTELLMQ